MYPNAEKWLINQKLVTLQVAITPTDDKSGLLRFLTKTADKIITPVYAYHYLMKHEVAID